MNVNRRDFLKGGAIAGSAAMFSGLFAGSALADEPQEAALPKGTVQADFDASVVELAPITDFALEETYDIVVIGSGTAGVPAAYTALEEGATVAVLQKESITLGNGNGSGAVILENSNALGLAAYKANWRKTGGYRINSDLLDLFVQKSGETSMWLWERSEEVGYVPYSCSVTENTYPGDGVCFTTLKSYGPKPDNHGTIMKLLGEACEAKGVKFFFSTPAVQLVQDETGRVVAAIGKQEDGTYVKLNATKAVIIAAGDYQNNESLVERYSPDVVPFGRKQANRTGDGILLAMLAGGTMTPANHAKTMHDMDAMPMLLTGYPFMALDSNAERFMNEDIPMASWDLSLRERKDETDDLGHFFRIFDDAYEEKYGVMAPPAKKEALKNYIPGAVENPTNVYPGLIDTHVADTIEGLAEELELDPAALQAAVDKWNAACAAGGDEAFGLDPSLMHPIDTPPYYGCRQWIRCSAINCGVTINGNCQVLDAAGEPIPGLYSVGSGAGDICGGLEWNLAQGGLCCGFYMTMGRYAAIHAVSGGMEPKVPGTLKYWEPKE